MAPPTTPRRAMVRGPRHLVPPPLHRVARLRSEPTDVVHGAVPRRPRRDPDQWARQDGGRLADAVAAPRRSAHIGELVPRRRLRHEVRREVAHDPRRPRRRRDRACPLHARQRWQRRHGRGPGLPRRRRPRRVRVLRLGRTRTARRRRRAVRADLRPDLRGTGGQLARGPLRASSSGRRRHPPAVPARRLVRQPTRHRLRTDLAGSVRARQPLRRGSAQPARRAAVPDRRRGSCQ